MNIKKLLFIIMVFLAGTVTGTLFLNEKIDVELGEMIINILQNPLFVLITGGGITSLLIPQLTNKIQDRKENFEIKRELMQNINKSTTRLLEKIKMLSTGISSKKDLHEEFFNWSESCAEIGTTVRAYWSVGKGGSVVEDEWNAYYEHVEKLYNVIINFEERLEHGTIENNIISFLKGNNSNFKLEYDLNTVSRITEDFFKETKDLTESETYPKRYSLALYDLVRLFDGRKYYLLKLVFKNKIKNH